ncbi:sigma factor-like helix-turn-helix DNA-binding protein, partial [Streptomyces fuscigenes]|uniref:sigma factor-like helix-turn-helix DNA-binding protein n=1 Tax=Streptomyces fuscigenes TaxID=1528880 RepID=UPI001F281BEE
DGGAPGLAGGPHGNRQARGGNGRGARNRGGAPRRLVVLATAPAAPGAVRPARTPEQAFDALYAYTSPGLVRQAYLLTGHRALARESVEQAFQLAWRRWPEVAVDRDPATWVRAAVHEYALSPWHRFRPVNRARAKLPTGAAEPVPVPDGRALREALLELPPAHRRAVLLYDGLGLDLPDAAAETEASTPATANRVLRARDTIAGRLPELADTTLLHERLDGLARFVPAPAVEPARTVRRSGERRTRMWTRAAIVLTVLIIGATIFTLFTAPHQYDPPEAPPEQVTGVPVPGGPQRLTPEDVKLHDALDALPMKGPERLLPRAQ